MSDGWEELELNVRILKLLLFLYLCFLLFFFFITANLHGLFERDMVTKGSLAAGLVFG